MMFCTSTVNVFAATVIQDGIEVSISTDKDDYAQSDHITATLNVVNTNDFEVLNVSLEELLPVGYTLSDGSSSTKFVSSIGANELISLSVTFLPNGSSIATSTTDDNEKITTTLANTTVTTDASKNNENNDESDTPDTGDDVNIVIPIIALIISAGLALVLVIVKKKTRNDILSLMICFLIADSFMIALKTEAADVSSKSISISETVNVENNSIIINAVVKYDMKNQETISPADEYYQNTSEKIISTEYANENNCLSEAEVSALLIEKHFDKFPISYEYDLNGTYTDEIEVDKNSTVKHPMYQTMYVAENGDVWNVFVVGKSIYACPLSYNFETDTEVEYIFGEKDTLVCYAEDNNKFYTTIPKDTVVAYNVVEAINAETLEKLTFEEIDKL